MKSSIIYSSDHKVKGKEALAKACVRANVVFLEILRSIDGGQQSLVGH